MKKKMSRQEAFDEVTYFSKVDPMILKTEAFSLIKGDFLVACGEGPDYVCNICHKCEYRVIVLLFDPSRYNGDIVEKCDTGKSNWICKTCDRSMRKGRMPEQAFNNGLGHCPDIKELNELCPLEIMLVSQIIPFMFIVGKTKGAQHGLKGQCVLVPTDLQKIQTTLPRNCSDEHLISLALKRRLTDKSAFHRQHIRPALVNRALLKLKEINPLYRDVLLDDSWVNVSEKNDPALWNILTSDNIEKKEVSSEMDTDEELDRNSHSKEKEQHITNAHPTVLHDIHGPNIDPSQILSIAPGEGQIPVSHINEPDCEALAFPKEFSTGQFHFNYKRERPITVLKYIHSRLKNCNKKYSENPQYLFYCLDWLEKEVVNSTKQFVLRKRFQSDISVSQLTNVDSVKNMISDDQLYASFKNVRGSPQYYKNMMLDVLAKVRQYGPYTFFLTCSAAEFKWTEIIQVVAKQYGEELSADQIEKLTWSEKLIYLKRNPVIVARQIDHIFKQLWGKVILSGMHPIGQILNYDERREFQNRGTEHIHAPIHIVGAPILDEDNDHNDNNVIDFIDKHISCSLPDKDLYPELSSLVKEVQTHHHTKSCRKKKGVTCRFNAPWPPSDKTLIIRGGNELDKNLVTKSKKTLDKVLMQLTQINELDAITLHEVLDMCNVSEKQYYEAVKNIQKKLTIIYKRKPSETNIGPYSTVVLSLLRGNMNIQFVNGIYAMLIYLTSYLCKPEHTMSELMKKAAKETNGREVMSKLHAIGNVFLTKREVSSHEAIKRELSLHMRGSNKRCEYIPTGLKKQRTRMLKSQNVLNEMDPNDTNVFAPNLLDRYENRPDSLNNMCLADFAANYISEKVKVKLDPDDVEAYTNPITEIQEEEEVEEEDSKTKIKLKNGLGKMRKRTSPIVIRFHTVSKLKSPEEFYLRLLQLYMPWRDETQLKMIDQSYEERYMEVKEECEENLQKHEPFTPIDYEELENLPDIDESDEEDDCNEFAMINPDMIDYDDGSDFMLQSTSIPSASVDNLFLPPEEFYSMCSGLNKTQRRFFNFFMTYVMMSKTCLRNNQGEPNPFYIYLSGGAGVGKSFLINVITEYAKRNLKFHGQNLDQPSIVVTASTGKAASHINGLTLHSAFHLQVNGNFQKNADFRPPSKELLQRLWNKYQYLKLIVVDEISMVGERTFNEYLNNTLQLIKRNKEPFGGVSIIASGDFLQLPPVMDRSVFQEVRNIGYKSLTGNLWLNHFLIYELKEVVRQSGDPEFAEILNRVREGEQTDADITEIKALERTDTTMWPNGFTKVYLTNQLANMENERCITALKTDTIVINAKDSARDIETQTLLVNISDNDLHKTGNLLGKLKICVGARVMLTSNINTSDKLINGSTGEVKYILMPRGGNNLVGSIYVKFDDPNAGNSLKNNRLKDELKHCVPITAITKTFPYSSRKRTVTVQRKQFPLKLGHAITGHNSQGATLEYMKGDFDRTDKYGKTNRVPINPGAAYTILSRAKTRDKLQLLNFEAQHIKVNNLALQEIQRMRKNAVFFWQHPLEELQGNKLALLNIRSWNLHLQHFLSDTLFLTNCDLLLFTETKTNGRLFDRMNQYAAGWQDIHEPTLHGLAICYKKESVQVLQVFRFPTNLEVMAIRIKIVEEVVLLCLVYCPPGQQNNNFVTELISLLSDIWYGERVIIAGDFNLDQLLPENTDVLLPLLAQFKLKQRSQYSTHNLGGILDLILDSKLDDHCSWVPSPFSDHFVLVCQI